MRDTTPLDRVIVGAGMSGLAHAVHARGRGDRVAVLEASDAVGGVIATQTTHGYRHERAATSIPSSAYDLRDLLAAVDAQDLLVPASEAAKAQFLLTASGLVPVPRSPPALLRTRLLSTRAKLRALGELVRGRRQAPEGETLHAFVTRRFGRAIADTFLRPFTNGIYGAAPERLGAADAFPRLVALERRRGGVLRGMMSGGLGGSASARAKGSKRQVLMPRDGTASLTAAVAASLGSAVHLGTHVARVEPGDVERPARVHTQDGQSFAAHELSLAIRAPAQAALLTEAYPHLADMLRAVDYVPMVVVAVGYASGAGPALPHGFGFLRGPGSTARILGATFNSCLNPAVAPAGGTLLTTYIGGSEDRAAVALDDDALRAIVLDDLAQALGGPIEPTLFDITRWTHAIPMFVPGHRGRMAAAAAELAAGRIRLLGSHATGVSLNDCCRPAAPVQGPLPTGLVRR